MEKALAIAKAKQLEGDHEDQQPTSEFTEGDLPSTQFAELDFVESPSEDFFCPVTLELLLNPHQTTCCGNHLSESAVKRLQRDGKPCPMCKEAQLVTMPDKFFKRKTRAVLIRCPHKASGCEWVGEVGGSIKHTEACPKRAWKCQYCNFESTFEVAAQHEDECTKYPIPCPNECVVNPTPEASPLSQTQVCMIPRCDMEKHRAKCPLEVVDCEFADAGCKVKITRQDLKHHMEESQQEHLLSATILNLKLTKEIIAEKDRQLAEKDHQIAEKDRLLAEQLADKDRQLLEKDKALALQENQVVEMLAKLQQIVLEFGGGEQYGVVYRKFTLHNFSDCQSSSVNSDGSWYSEPFDINYQGYQIQLCVEAKEEGSHMNIRLYSYDGKPMYKVFVVVLQLLNQQSNNNHILEQWETRLTSSYSDRYPFVLFKDLNQKDKNVQYLKHNRLEFVMWIKERKSF